MDAGAYESAVSIVIQDLNMGNEKEFKNTNDETEFVVGQNPKLKKYKGMIRHRVKLTRIKSHLEV